MSAKEVEIAKSYGSENIKVNEMDELRKKFGVIEISKRIRKKGDRLILSNEVQIRPRILQSAKDEGRVLALLPLTQKSKASILARLKTDREILLFADKYNIKTTSPKRLLELVRSWNLEMQDNPFLVITQEEHDLFMGSLLGDASVRQRERYSCFRVAHSIRQEGYINWKLNLLTSLNVTEFVKRTRIINDHTINMVYLSTKTHPLFNYYRNLFYKDGRKLITEEILDQITPRSLAIWICDDGSYDTKQGYIVLCTNAFSLEEHNLMKKIFNEKFGLDPTIGFRDNKYYYLRFKQEDSRKLISIIRPFIPDCMLYKIGEAKDEK